MFHLFTTNSLIYLELHVTYYTFMENWMKIDYDPEYISYLQKKCRSLRQPQRQTTFRLPQAISNGFMSLSVLILFR